MRKLRLALLFAFLLIIPASASAPDFGIMESAETINKGNFKLRANPMLLFGKGADSDIGIAAMLGYGFTPRFDLEGGVAIYDGVTFLAPTANTGSSRNRRSIFLSPLDFIDAWGMPPPTTTGSI